MLDFGIAEVGVVAIVALIVIGPKHLPGLAKRCGFWLGKYRAWWHKTKKEADEAINKINDDPS